MKIVGQGFPIKQSTLVAAFVWILVLAGLSGCALGPSTPATPANQVGDLDTLVSGLKASGAQVELGEEVQEPFFSVPGRTLQVGDLAVIVFEYADEASRQAESSTIGPDGFSVGTSKVDWVALPNFWAQGRLIVLYLGEDQGMIDRLTNLLGSPVTSH